MGISGADLIHLCTAADIRYRNLVIVDQSAQCPINRGMVDGGEFRFHCLIDFHFGKMGMLFP
jgi:hypothetical protein